ncbi:hypothetical protein ALQ30_200479 [Pseudomonas syringae pv. persicae]|uniref:Uncharacterized protein n=1 Tax=Pseudomonas syringae pv. persicae TaxID=237306 RepID=A0A3M4A1E1_9PSED|nr:hypothetical protein ALQ30_200479 [Pseudomonas syringae pv. persicae]
MTAAVVQVIQVLAGRKRQRGQVAERIVLVGQRALRRSFFDEAAEQVVGEVDLFSGDAQFSA